MARLSKIAVVGVAFAAFALSMVAAADPAAPPIRNLADCQVYYTCLAPTTLQYDNTELCVCLDRDTGNTTPASLACSVNCGMCNDQYTCATCRDPTVLPDADGNCADAPNDSQPSSNTANPSPSNTENPSNGCAVANCAVCVVGNPRRCDKCNARYHRNAADVCVADVGNGAPAGATVAGAVLATAAVLAGSAMVL